MLQQTTSGYLCTRSESRNVKKYLYIHSGMVHNSRKVPAAQVSTDGWRGKQKIVYTYSGILSSLKSKEVQMHVTIWMKLLDIMWSEISQ